MKEIKAYIHRNRVADVVRALSHAGFSNISIVDVKGLLDALDSREQDFSIEIGAMVITEVKVELVCHDENSAAEAVRIISDKGRTGQAEAGWIYITNLQAALQIRN